MVALTIGMPTFNDFDGVYFTIQSLRMVQDLEDTEIVVVDNYGCEHTRAFVENWAKARYVLATDAVGTAAAKNRVFAEATGEAVLCLDSHIRFFPGTIARLKDYFRAHPDSRDLLQGPLVYDDLKTISTNFDPVWRGQMWGIWATDPRGLDPAGEPFEIWGQGMGVFSCRKDAWPGFHPDFRGFGGEEGYIHEKVRQHGGRVLCLPWLRWVHRFGRPAGVPYTISVADKFRNYLIGHVELGLDLGPVVEHFSEHMPAGTVVTVTEEVMRSQTVMKPRQEHGQVHEKEKKKKKVKKSGKGGKGGPAPNSIVLELPSSDSIAPDSRAVDNGERLPLVSCICSTYNRPSSHQYLVEEAIESFLRQDYPNKELIVLNDCPGQELVCDAPGVRVINVPERFPSLGEKHNAAIALARGELIAIWDDDDISLPWRLSLSVERLGDADYFNPKRFWMMSREELQLDPKSNVGHNLSLYRRSAFEAVGGYPPVGAEVDVKLDRAFLRAVRCVGSERLNDGALTYNELYYIYRWEVSPAHLSASNKTAAEKYARVGSRPVEPGRFELRPHWRKDYLAETRRLIAWIARSADPDREEISPDESIHSAGAEGGDGSRFPARLAIAGPNQATIEAIQASGALTIAEIGVYEGHTSEEIARYLNGRGELHLFDFTDKVEKVAERLHNLGYENVVAHGNSYKALDSYNWSLMRLLEKHKEPIFDYVFIDGAHSWAHDALAFLLVDRLLKPGGFVDFSNYTWSFEKSPSLSPRVFPLTAELYTQEQIEERQVALVVDNLVRRDPRFVEVVRNKVFRKLAPERSSPVAPAAANAAPETSRTRSAAAAAGAALAPLDSSAHESPRVVLGDPWNLGNELFRTMSSVYLAAVVGARKLEGVRLPALGITTTIDGPVNELFPVQYGHVLPIEDIQRALHDSSVRGVRNNGYGQRFEYISGQQPFWRAQFDRLALDLPSISPSEVVVNIRAGDILKPVDGGYFPLPLDFYDVILEELGMAPVFVGQVVDDHPYIEKLRSRYPSARYIHGSILEDFELLRRCHTKILSISTFSWLAGWLGSDDSRVIMPVAGLFNPEAAPTINLLPTDDGRFTFRRFSPMKRKRSDTDLEGFLDALADASEGYPQVGRSAFVTRDLRPVGLYGDPARPTVRVTPDEWSSFAEAVILRQREQQHSTASLGNGEDGSATNTLQRNAAAAAEQAAAITVENSRSKPLVSCICPTFNRPPDHQYLLEEAIESFLRQDYPNKELIVLNDCPGQELVCDAPGVRIINAPARFPTLGDKRNAAIALARGELIAPWDDDDISLPWRLSLSVERLGSSAYFNPKNYWFLDRRGLHYDHTLSTAHGKSLFTRSGYEKVGGYPAISLGDDTDLDRALTQYDKMQVPGRGAPPEIARAEWHYIYRWGISPIHTSSRDESGYQEIGSQPIQSGRFFLNPRWLVDYEGRTRQLVEAAAPIDYLARRAFQD